MMSKKNIYITELDSDIGRIKYSNNQLKLEKIILIRGGIAKKRRIIITITWTQVRDDLVRIYKGNYNNYNIVRHIVFISESTL